MEVRFRSLCGILWNRSPFLYPRSVISLAGGHELRRNAGKGSSLPWKEDEDAAAAAELLFVNGGRKPLECTGNYGLCKDVAVREQQ